MSEKEHKPRGANSAGILGVFIFLLLWGFVEHIVGTEPKNAPPGTTFDAADRAGAVLTPSDRGGAPSNL